MKYVILFFILMVLCLNLFSQELIKIPLKINDKMIEENRFYRFYINNNAKKTNAKKIVLSNGEISINYGKLFICINSKELAGDTITIMPGVTKNLELFIRTVNKRENVEDIKDNYISTDFSIKNDTDYYHNIKKIDIDSIRVLHNGQTVYTKFSFFATIVKTNWEFVKDSNDLVNLSKGFSLNLVSNYCLEGFYTISNDSFKVNIILNPRSSNLYNYKIDSSWYLLNTIKIYKKIQGRDSVIFYNRISDLNIDNFSSKPFTYNNKKFKIKKIDFQENYVALYSCDSAECNFYNEKIEETVIFNNLLVYNIQQDKNISLNFDINKKYYFLFTGSWCKPCNEVFNDIAKRKLEFNNLKDFYVVDLEGNLKTARNYSKKYPQKWNLLYVPLAGYNNNEVKHLFKISNFPSFVIVENNQIKTSMNGSSDILNELKSILSNTGINTNKKNH